MSGMPVGGGELREAIVACLHSGIEGVECSHVDYRTPSYERDADALLAGPLAQVVAERDAAVAAVERVRELHTAYDPGDDCTQCYSGISEHPCPTLEALEVPHG